MTLWRTTVIHHGVAVLCALWLGGCSARPERTQSSVEPETEPASVRSAPEGGKPAASSVNAAAGGAVSSAPRTAPAANAAVTAAPSLSPVPAGAAGMSAGAGAQPSAAGAASATDPAYRDPGTGPWEVVPEADVARVCKLDPAKLAEADRALGVPYAVVRYGKLCHRGGAIDSPAEIWSITKGLTGVVAGVVSYQTRDISRSGPMTGQFRDWDRADHWLPASSISFNREATVAHVMAMIAHNTDLSFGARTYQYDAVGSVQINRLSDMMNTAIHQDTGRLGEDLEQFTRKFLFEPLGMQESTWSDGAPDKICAYSWTTTLNDMLRLGTLMMHRGLWAGQRVLDESWVYKMTHVSFEDSNSGWGYLARLTSRRVREGEANTTTAETDACTPVAVWPYYPHGLSEAKDCLLADPAQCKQDHDVGMFGWQGAGGQWLAVHPGLDLVLAAKNLSSGNNAAVWAAVRPALVALDDKYKADETAFCADYGAGKYAPDLAAPWVAPMDKP
jgi:CubicO group peptidase (beta-lactamase class C family)